MIPIASRTLSICRWSSDAIASASRRPFSASSAFARFLQLHCARFQMRPKVGDVPFDRGSEALYRARTGGNPLSQRLIQLRNGSCLTSFRKRSKRVLVPTYVSPSSSNRNDFFVQASRARSEQRQTTNQDGTRLRARPDDRGDTANCGAEILAMRSGRLAV